MASSVSQSAARANAKLRDVGAAAGICALVVSLLAHGALVGATAVRGAGVEPSSASAAASASGRTETDLVDVEASHADAALRGDEDKAQGAPGSNGEPVFIDVDPTPKDRDPTPSRAATIPPAVSPATTLPTATTPTAKPPATALPTVKPPAAASPAAASPAAASPPVASPPIAPPPVAAQPPARSAPSDPPKTERAASASSGLLPSDAPPRPAGSSDAPSSAPVSDGSSSGPGGAGGGQKRRGERDLASTFTYELPDCAFYVDAWAALPLGDAGALLASIDVDPDGKVVSAKPEPDTNPPAPFVETLKRVALRLKVSKLALENGEIGGGSLHVRITATVSEVPAPDRPGGAVAIEHTFDKGRGRASFTLENGRRVEFVITVVKVAHAT